VTVKQKKKRERRECVRACDNSTGDDVGSDRQRLLCCAGFLEPLRGYDRTVDLAQRGCYPSPAWTVRQAAKVRGERDGPYVWE
jgi:hypothetical protein